jgi:hypothetical protein
MTTAAAQISKEYDVQSGTNIRFLLSNCIVENNGDIDNLKTIYKTEELVKTASKDSILDDKLNTARTAVRGFLNQVYFSLPNLEFNDDSSNKSRCNEMFWFDYAYRFKKVCTVMIILERANLLKFDKNAKPQKTDIPVCLSGLLRFIYAFYGVDWIDRMRQRYISHIDSISEFCIVHYYHARDLYVKGLKSVADDDEEESKKDEPDRKKLKK